MLGDLVRQGKASARVGQQHLHTELVVVVA